MSLQLKNFEEIKARAIHADIQPHQEALSADEVELKSTAQQSMTQAEEKIEKFISHTKEEIHRLGGKNQQINHMIDSNGLLSCAGKDDEVLKAIVTHIQKDFEHSEEIFSARKKLMESDGVLRRFKAVNRLTRGAKYPKDFYPLFVIISGIFLFEVLVNMFFYANDEGLIGGFFVASILALVNIGVCAGLGFLARQHNLVQNNYRKKIGFASIFALVVFLILFNLVLVVYRDTLHMIEIGQLVTDPSMSGVAVAATDVILGRAFPVLNPQNLGFFFIAILFGFISAWKGYTLMDPYPGYQEVDEPKQKYQDEYDSLVAKVQPDLTIAKLLSQLDGIVRDSHGLHVLSSLKSALIEGAEEYEVTRDRINHDLSNAIDYFREQHLSVRANGMSKPKYFTDNQPVVVKFRKIPIENIIKSIEEATAKNEILDDRVKKIIVPVISTVNLHRPRIATEARAEFIRRVDSSAEQSIHPVV